MKKNGFVSTSLIYTFFIVFLLLMLFLLNSYSRVRFLLEDYKYDIKDSFANASVADINVYFMLWDSVTQEYELTDNMPVFGYVYEPEFSYCKNGSQISYTNGNISVTASRRDSCYIYFKEIEKDIVLNIYKKDSADGKKVLVNNVPSVNYNFTDYSCTNGATLTFDQTTRKFKITSANKTVCDVEFTRKEMDIVINIFKESTTGEHEYNGLKYTEVVDLPGSNYTFDSFICKNGKANIVEENGELTVEASGKDECNVYFNGGNDKVEIIIMQETETGVSGYTTGKFYSRVYQAPGAGYAYIGYICEDSSATVTYQNGIFVGTSNTQTICRVYFNQYSTNTAIINYFLEKSDGNYESVTSVPDIGYVFNSSKSGCTNGSSYQVVNNYVIVNANSNDEICNFYYDQANADIKVLVYVMNRETQKYELGSVPVVGYDMYSAGCTNSASIEYKNSELIITSDGPTVCTVYFR